MILPAIWIRRASRMREWIRKQTRAEAKKEKGQRERLRYLQAQLTDQVPDQLH